MTRAHKLRRELRTVLEHWAGTGEPPAELLFRLSGLSELAARTGVAELREYDEAWILVAEWHAGHRDEHDLRAEVRRIIGRLARADASGRWC